MIYKRKRNTLDPTRISNYNKFLTTMDRKNIQINKLPIFYNTKPIVTTPINFKPVKSEEEIKKDIDFIIDQITNNFTINDFGSHNFSGQTNNDIAMANVRFEDPNYYQDNLKRNSTFFYRPTKQRDISNCEIDTRDTIFIDTEVNNINDILELIKKYNIDPLIKYNINMKALHDIKQPLEELNNMIGMKDLKNNIVDQILYFIQGLHKNKDASGDFMHTVIYGPPGTGKTDIAKIMGKIYSKIGVLSKGTFKKVTRSDLIAGYLGQTALKTRDVIKEAIGGVLFIDEAYALGNTEKRDSFSKECIDTLCEALSDNKENLMVIIAGYEKELKECFFNYNQGLDSRFVWRFKTDEYSGEDLYNIFIKKVKDIGWEIAEDSNVSIEWFNKNKDHFKFYGRDIETVLAKTKIAHSRRVFCKNETEKKKLNLQDLEKGFTIFTDNDDAKSRREEEYKKRELYNSLYC